jgi:hypothetical protein
MLRNATFLRWVIALTVVGITLWLAARNPNISNEWEAVFLAVIGYYFKDRPVEEDYKSTSNFRDVGAVLQETTWQFSLASILVLGTFLAFILPKFKPSISGVWIGAVVLALGFYFKETGIPEIERRHDIFRAVLATTLTLLTFPLLWSASNSTSQFEVPLQWVGIVFIVVTFYFKEKSTERQPPQNITTNDEG